MIFLFLCILLSDLHATDLSGDGLRKLVNELDDSGILIWCGLILYMLLQLFDELYYELEGNRWACVRPSGTEPKIKVYFGTCAPTQEEARQSLSALEADMSRIIGL